MATGEGGSPNLLVGLVHKFLPVLLFLQCGVESHFAALPDELAGNPESVPQVGSVARLCQ